MTHAPSLQLKSATIGYKTPIAEPITASVDAGCLCVLIGANGTGKSTLIKSICKEIKILDGEIIINGKPIKEYSHKMLAHHIALVTTEHSMMGGLTAGEVVATGRYPDVGLIGKLSKEDKEIIKSAMQWCGINHKRDEKMAHLSDGERQKVMISRALARTTPLLILDEPLSFLDPAARIEIMELLRNIARRDNKAILMSSHDVAQAMRMADKIWMIDAQGKFNEGTPQEMTKGGLINLLFENKCVKFDESQNDFVILNP